MPLLISCFRIADLRKVLHSCSRNFGPLHCLGCTAHCKYRMRYGLNSFIRLSPITCALYAETLRVITSYIETRISKQMFIAGYRPSVTLHTILPLIRKKNSKSLIQNFLPYLNLFLYHYPKFL